jgi:hypothetical protein
MSYVDDILKKRKEEEGPFLHNDSLRRICEEERKSSMEIGRFLAYTVVFGVIGGVVGALKNYNVPYDTVEHGINFDFECLPFAMGGVMAGAAVYGLDRLVRGILGGKK